MGALIQLSEYIKVQSEYNGASRNSFWTDLKVGDVLYIHTSIERIYNNRAPVVWIRNNRTQGKVACGMGQMHNYLKKFDYEVFNAARGF